MTVLCVDTSAAVSVSLLSDDGTAIASRTLREQRRHAELLTPLIKEIFDESGLDSSSVTTVVAGTGPAPFTGLRVGLVTGRTFAFGVGTEPLGVCSLDALAAEAAQIHALEAGTKVLAVSDARRREVYYALYTVGELTAQGVPEVTVVEGPEVASAADLIETGLARGAVVVGEGAALYAEAFAGADVRSAPAVPSTTVLAQLALARRGAGVDQPTTPLYLRRPDAQVPGARKRALG
ncbi:tRNA (adenosine(37)-N6)-threonylcarbamoyltransferase complex dimerization subunit type 1 TsaB [Timonella senegalensis]|uniref:tRNA (adenosine(37)-N6)-threonylcarbamoyltransferase complex dimerization subunit type 1 TsaB n=1 Tax=Timonella senegalensis TaxID=1465825 RepID=UPI0028A8D2DA|nr:tRNA (adenosine(37)-N6)-threonylcarbamoyltransferase complex dimerization subunit type 1 TsaB [Timonella senegalensis]